MKILVFSLKHWGRGRVLIALSVVVIGVIVVRILVTGYHQSTVHTQQTSTSFGAGMPDWETNPENTDEYNEYQAWIQNDLTRQRSPWTMVHIQPLLDHLNNPPEEKYYEEIDKRVAEKDLTLTWQDFEPDDFFGASESAVCERFRRDEPMDPDVRAALVKRFVELMQSDRPRLRDKFTALVQYARMPRDPAVRAKMISLYGDNAMEHFDKLERLYDKDMLVK